MAAIRRVPKSPSGGRGEGTAPPSVSCFVGGRVCPQPANDNASPHGGRDALCWAGGVVLTLVASVWMALALPWSTCTWAWSTAPVLILGFWVLGGEDWSVGQPGGRGGGL